MTGSGTRARGRRSTAVVLRRAVLGAAVVGVLLLSGCAGDPVAPSASSTDEVSSGYVSGDGSVETWPAPDRGEPVELAGASFDEQPVDIGHWRADVVVVNFWYAACPPCRKEAPDLAAVSADYADDGVHLLGVNHTDDPGTALAFERRFEIPYPTLNDVDASGVAAMQGAVPLQAMPTTVVLDGEGRVVARILGLADPSVLRALIDDVLAE
ncbi:MAG: TlpA family protein disulfide reductase [Actinomycetales bacterium]|nr:TlpA family protein disulfide reductase [Actinomycetales bacterium]